MKKSFQKSTRGIVKIEDYLYLGTYRDAISNKKLEKHDIKVLINMAQEFTMKNIPKIIEYNFFGIDDTNDQELDLQPILKCINEYIIQKKNVLVFCMAGKSRSASVIVNYIMEYNNKTLKQSYILVKRKRQIINPNIGFREQLMEMERKKYGNISKKEGDWEKKY